MLGEGRVEVVVDVGPALILVDAQRRQVAAEAVRLEPGFEEPVAGMHQVQGVLAHVRAPAFDKEEGEGGLLVEERRAKVIGVGDGDAQKLLGGLGRCVTADRGVSNTVHLESKSSSSSSAQAREGERERGLRHYD